MTFVDYLEARWHRQTKETELRKIANIIAWNLWQMDGLTGTVPLGGPEEVHYQYSLFSLEDNVDGEVTKKAAPCRIYDWRAK